ncbi:MAG: hypothetical protein K8F90_13000 [Hyphomicrobiales bacterium]|nr:hypothetical protein [Hyphomicrobiales bacterium]
MDGMSAMDSADAGHSSTQSKRKMSKKRPEKDRLNLYLPASLSDRIEKAQEYTLASSASQVVTTALLLYLTLLEEHKEGNDLYVISKEGVKTRYPVFYR